MMMINTIWYWTEFWKWLCWFYKLDLIGYHILEKQYLVKCVDLSIR